MPVTSWRGPQYSKKVKFTAQQNLNRAAIFLVGKIKQSFGAAPPMPEGWQPNNPYKQWSFYDKKKKKGRRLREVGAERTWRLMHHSKPGEPPFVQTGALRMGVTWRVGSRLMSRFVGVVKSVHYAMHLEMGTRAGGTIRPVNKKALYWPGAAHPVAKVEHKGMAARPYLRPALQKYGRKIADIIGGRR